MTGLKICLATKKDFTELLESFEHYKNKWLAKKRVECFLSHNFTVVAKINNKIVGVLQWHIQEVPIRGVVAFEEVHVLKEYRKQGIGSAIIVFAIDCVKKHFKKIGLKPRRIFLFVSKKNKIARALYEKCGFKKTAELGKLFDDKETELFYTLNL